MKFHQFFKTPSLNGWLFFLYPPWKYSKVVSPWLIKYVCRQSIIPIEKNKKLQRTKKTREYITFILSSLVFSSRRLYKQSTKISKIVKRQRVSIRKNRFRFRLPTQLEIIWEWWSYSSTQTSQNLQWWARKARNIRHLSQNFTVKVSFLYSISLNFSSKRKYIYLLLFYAKKNTWILWIRCQSRSHYPSIRKHISQEQQDCQWIQTHQWDRHQAQIEGVVWKINSFRFLRDLIKKRK